MQPLVKRWTMLNDDDRDLFPLLEVSLSFYLMTLKLKYYYME